VLLPKADPGVFAVITASAITMGALGFMAGKGSGPAVALQVLPAADARAQSIRIKLPPRLEKLRDGGAWVPLSGDTTDTRVKDGAKE
jgi:hypothetical protein